MLLLSILIPTLEQRSAQFDTIFAKLNGQIQTFGLSAEVEIISLRDGGEMSTGAKRNRLQQRAAGRYVVSVDDDDDVNDRYVPLIVDALRARPSVDCLGIKGVITFNGRHPQPFVYSIRHPEYRTCGRTYLRPPHHLNPIRRDIAVRYAFADVRAHEDADWA